MTLNPATFYKIHPSAVTIYQLPEPLDVTLDATLQAEIIFTQARLNEVNPATALRMEREGGNKFKGTTMADLLLQYPKEHLSRGELISRLTQFVADDYSLEDISAQWKMAGKLHEYKTSYYGLVSEQHLIRVVVVHRGEAVRRFQERLVSNIALSLVAQSDDAFFAHLVARLAQTLELDFAVVAECQPGSDGMVRVLAFYDARNQQFANIDEDKYLCLKNSPSYEALKGKTCIYRSGVATQFPRDPYLQKLNIDSCIAVPIFGENNQQLGLLSLMHRSELSNVELIKSVLNIFSLPASAEIQRRRIELEKQRHERQQKIFIDNNSSGMFVVDIDPPMPLSISLQKQVQWLAENSHYVECNEAMVKILAYADKKSLIGRSFYGNRVVYDFATHARDFIAQKFLLRDHLIQIKPANGVDTWLSSNVSSIIRDGYLTQILGVVSDVTERVSHSREMEHRAKHDGLTGLPNRSYFIERVEQLLALSNQSNRHALYLLDLDGFKEVNDTLGHETGDYLLQQIGPRLQSVLTPYKSFVARLGGDEFAILIENYSSEDVVEGLAGDLMEAIKSPFSINELELTVGGSVGIALYPLSGENASSLMRCADIAMYQAKQHSQDYCLYSADHDHYTVRRLSLMMDIRQAIKNNELCLHYQPIIDIKTQDVEGFEALIRWQHPKHGMLPPGEFIPLIELTDMIMPVTNWVVETAIKQLAEWLTKGWEYSISVNVSTRNLVDAGFVSFIENCLQRYQVDGRLLDVEITESTLMADPEKARSVLQSLSTLGVHISIDDYGTGYSSLAYLKSLPINTLKIDQTFISQMLTSPQDQIIVKSTIQLAHNLGLKVTAEGIEDASLIGTLAGLGCDKGQGYYFCKPVMVDDLGTWLSLHHRKLLAS